MADTEDPLEKHKATRKAYYDDYALSIEPRREWQLESVKLSQEWARLAVRTCFVLNGGALALLATLARQTADTRSLQIQAEALSTAAWWFVGGIIVAGICAVVGYANMLRNADAIDHEVWQDTNRLLKLYFKSEIPERDMEVSAESMRKAQFDVSATVWAGIGLGIGSLVCFGKGALVILG